MIKPTNYIMYININNYNNYIIIKYLIYNNIYKELEKYNNLNNVIINLCNRTLIIV